MKKLSEFLKISIIWLFSLLGLFLLFYNWLPEREAFFLTLGIPFLYFIPGFFIANIFFCSTLDYLEKVTLSILFSIILSHLGIFLIEETSQRINLLDIIFVIGIINIFCVFISLLHHGISKRHRNRSQPLKRNTKETLKDTNLTSTHS